MFGLQLVAVATVAGTASAATVTTGTGGQFVAATGRVMDTRNGTGTSTGVMTPGNWRSLQVAGLSQFNLPATGISSVQVTLTAVNPTGEGAIHVGATTSSTANALIYNDGVNGTVTNTAIVPVDGNGKIYLEATGSSTDLLVDLEGYYTAGAPAAAGYVPSPTPARIVDTRNGTGLPQAPLTNGSTPTITVAGHAGVPAGASAVFVNFEVLNGSTSAGYLLANAYGAPTSQSSLNFPGSVSTALGAVVPLSADGKMSVKYVGVSGSINLLVDIAGYFAPAGGTLAGGGQGAFTPAATRVVNSVTIPASTTQTFPVAGVNGVPVAGSGITAIAANVQLVNAGSAGGWLAVYADNAASAGAAIDDAPNSTRSNFVTVALGPDGGIKIQNGSPTDSVRVYVDVQGWYTSLSTNVVVNQQNTTQRQVNLKASTAGGGSWVTYKYRVGTAASTAFTPIPNSELTDSSNSSPTQPVTTSGSPAAFGAYTWNIADTLGTSTTDALVQVEACYGQSSTTADADLVCSMPSNITYSPAGFGMANATAGVGPGTLSLLTGDYQLSATDAAVASSVDGLSIGRSLTTLAPAAANTTATGVFGPGWSADLSGPSAGQGDLTPIDHHPQGYLEFTDASGYNAYYAATTSLTAYPITFAGVGDNAGDGESVKMTGASTITMADPDGTVTTWTKASTGAWQVSGITEAGSNTTATYTYNGTGLVTRIIAPTPAGLSTTCTNATADTTVGCRSLVLGYTTIAGASRLTTISASIPTGVSGYAPTPVEHYDYDSTGRLQDAYDPRISPHLVTSYTYDSTGRVARLTAPGINPWAFVYDGTGRLIKVQQAVPVTDPTTGTFAYQFATSTIVYGVPNAGIDGNLRPNLNASVTATWGESSDLPVDGDATAIFPPDHVPAGTTASTVGDSDWPYAAIHYLDVQGREVNTATYGANDWQIESTQYDTNGDDIWDLSASNRDQALNPTTGPSSPTDSYVAAITSPDPTTGQAASALRANLLATTTAYNPLDTSEVTDTYGPTHPVTLSTGAVVHARSHTSTTYDEGAPYSDVDPATGAAYRLSTTVVTDPYNVATNADSAYPDASTTTSGYTAIGSMSGQTVKSSDGTVLKDSSGNAVPLTGWSLGQATTSTVRMGATASAADMTATTVYDADGRTIQTRLPGDTTGTSPRATNTTYYTATGTGACVSPLSAGLVCQTAPGGQPSTGKPLPTTTEAYDAWGNTLTTAQTYGTGTGATVRTTTNTYDNAERPLTTGTSVTNAPSDNTDVPTVTITYDPNTGQVATKTSGTGTNAQSLTSVYNSVGALASYADATGNVTATGYDIDGRPITQTDNKGTVQLAYDSAGEHRGLVTSEDIGTTSNSRFTATYDADGNLTQTYPGGTTATGTYDNAGNQTVLTYTNNGSTLASFTQTFGTTNTGTDHVVAQASTVNGTPYSSQAFTDDAAGRLTTVADTYNGTCTTRKYGFGDPTSDAADYFDSNRTSLTSYPAATSGACSNSTTPTTTSYSYDQADRLTSDTTGGSTNTYAYDALGRTSTLPGGDATGIGSHNAANGGPTGDLTLGYYSNDMVATQAQGTGSNAATIGFTLDPDQNRISTQATTTAAGVKTITNHYDDGSDATAWTSTRKVDGTTVTKRYVDGIDGGLDAVVADDGTVKLDLTNLHGDTVATIDPDATSITSYHETTEFGLPRDPATAADDYGALGARKRSTDDLGGLTLMGVRLYNPATGHFLSTDPISGGNDNAYVYPADPIDGSDYTGRNHEANGAPSDQSVADNLGLNDPTLKYPYSGPEKTAAIKKAQGKDYIQSDWNKYNAKKVKNEKYAKQRNKEKRSNNNRKNGKSRNDADTSSSGSKTAAVLGTVAGAAAGLGGLLLKGDQAVAETGY
ncbi:RHS repeat-associated core domain-containing protein [Nocardioides sp. BP30]|uniref:RHS repeat-associated core domain-containing protein n=1 Tax=Nocardioides sp. BP30 TaxID=3036374 RepID=UPI00246980C4|nr:RHS repeat-associated core domain-containing protein [Nocardioides sp. BP30]WGL50735.1 RHS repeat-associated core domain-containing protein [Nocardioides sp. BP30]